MGFFRRSLKAYIMAICIFVVLTLILAALICFTSFDEDWSVIGLSASMAVAALLLGVMEGSIVGRRGLLVGIVSAAVLVMIIWLAIRGIFAGTSEGINIHTMYLVPLLTGAVGGIVGANSRKS